MTYQQPQGQPWGDEPSVRQRSEIIAYAVAPEPPREPGAPWRKRPRVIAAAVLVAVAAAGGVGIAVSGSSSSANITIHGSLGVGLLGAIDTAPGAVLGSPVAGDPCQTAGGYADIAQGTTVTITGSAGQTLAQTALGTGVENAQGYCAFSFTAQVAGGQSSYSVSISHRGSQTFTPAQVQAGITLSLGN